MINFYASSYFRFLIIKKFLLIFLIFKCTTSSSQQKDSFLIWENSHSLTWKDFWGKNTMHGDTAALSYLELSLLISYDSNKEPIFTIVPLFIRSKSFILKYNYFVLNHEQQHFNILEIFSRKIRKSFDEIEKLENTTSSDYYNLFYKYRDSLAIYQSRYDLQTDHSRNSSNQKTWNSVIAKKLRDLEEYSIKNYYNLDN